MVASPELGDPYFIAVLSWVGTPAPRAAPFPAPRAAPFNVDLVRVGLAQAIAALLVFDEMIRDIGMAQRFAAFVW